MKTSDRPAFAEVLAYLREAFGGEVSTMRAEVYFDALEDLDLEAIQAAAKVAVRTKTFFPKPAELRELIEGSTEDRAEVAWQHVMAEVRHVGSWGHPSLKPNELQTVRDIWGSWQHLCETLPGEGPELMGWRKRWVSVYEVRSKRTALDAAWPSGLLHE
jgi:hypothetical protein